MRQDSIERSRTVPFTQLDHIQLAMPAGAEDLARKFYAGLLGMEEVAKPAQLASRGGVWFISGSVSIHLGVDADFIPARKAHPALRCSEYSSLITHLRDHAIGVSNDSSSFEGKDHCYIADPFGNRIELIDG